MKRFLIVFAAVANLVLVDAVVKEIAGGCLKGSAAISVIPGLFNLAYVENRGCAWGLFQGQVWPLAVFGLVALAFLIWKRKAVFGLETKDARRGWLILGAVAEPLLYAGIIGNVIDRLFRGYVIDMFDFHWGVHHFPCFNIADSCICVAVGLLLLTSLRSETKRRSTGARISCEIAEDRRWTDIAQVWLGQIVEDISYNNANRYFGFEV